MSGAPAPGLVPVLADVVRLAAAAVLVAPLAVLGGCAAPPDGTAELVVEHAEAGSRTRTEVSLDDVSCTASDSAWSISSGPTDDAAASGPPIGDLTVVRTYGDSVSTLVLALGDGRFFLSQEPLEPGEGKIRLGGHQGVVVDGYGTTEQQTVAEGATLTGTITCDAPPG